ncbi:MAG: hypothetical protein ABSB74_12130, partial [Tepidisphaeraceae bacterium]
MRRIKRDSSELNSIRDGAEWSPLSVEQRWPRRGGDRALQFVQEWSPSFITALFAGTNKTGQLRIKFTILDGPEWSPLSVKQRCPRRRGDRAVRCAQNKSGQLRLCLDPQNTGYFRWRDWSRASTSCGMETSRSPWKVMREAHRLA